MGEVKSMAKAKMDLEELYSGIPDDSVNLTFQDLAQIQQNMKAAAEKKKSSSSLSSPSSSSSTSSSAVAIMEPIQEAKTPPRSRHPPPSKLPSLDFNTGLQASRTHPLDDLDRRVVVAYGDHHDQPHRRTHIDHDDGSHSPLRHYVYGNGRDHRQNSSHHPHQHRRQETDDQLEELRYAMEKSKPSDDHDAMSGISMASPYPDKGGKTRRPGIPHSNICTICSTYIYIFRHRCLVCGRVYCRNCVFVGMGEMKEGRKCIECLGRKFSQSSSIKTATCSMVAVLLTSSFGYIQRAGKIGCCSRYPRSVKQAELKWAEKGPRRTSERGYSLNPMGSRSVSPVTPRTPTRAQRPPNETPSFVSNTPYSPYRHHIPL